MFVMVYLFADVSVKITLPSKHKKGPHGFVLDRFCPTLGLPSWHHRKQWRSLLRVGNEGKMALRVYGSLKLKNLNLLTFEYSVSERQTCLAFSTYSHPLYKNMFLLSESGKLV